MSATVDLVRDVLDAQLVDRAGRPIGRVDGVVLMVQDGQRPRVIAVEVGAMTVARRIHPRLARWLRAIAARVSPVPFMPVRIPPALFRDIGVDIQVDVDAGTDRRLLRAEKWLRRHVIGRLPWGGG